MSDPIWQTVGIPVVTTFAGFVGGAVAGYHYGIKLNRHERLLAFQSDISVLLGQMPDDERGAQEFLDSTRDRVRDLCSARRQDIKRCRRTEFMSARADYCEARNPVHEAFVHESIHARPATSLPRPMRQTMRDALQRLIDYAT